MCYNCGCGNPEDDMGHEDNIVNNTFKHLAEHWGKSPEDTKKEVFQMLEDNKVEDPHLAEMFEKASKAWGQSVEQAKKNTYSLLKSQMRK